MTTIFWIAAAAGAVLLFTLMLWRESRRQLLARIRREWGVPRTRSHNLDAIGRVCCSRLAATPGAAWLDDRTWADLDLDEVFAAVDRTESTLGQEALYYRLRRAPVSDHLEAFESLVNRLSTDAPARERAQIALARLQDPHGYDVWWLAASDAVETRRWHVLFPLLTASTVILIVATLLWHALAPELVTLLAIDVGVRFLAAGQASTVGNALRQIAPIIATAEAMLLLHDEQRDDLGPRLDALPDDVEKLRRLKTVTRWLSGDPFMLSFAADGLAAVASSFAQAVYEYLDLILLLDANGLLLAARDVRAHSDSLLRLTAAVGDVDAAISVASWRHEREDWTRPVFAPSATTAMVSEVRHPLVRDAVANTVVLEPGRGLLVTGSNMSGKSTFLRTIGVNIVLAQTIHTCLARAYDAPIFRVQSCIGRADDLLAGKSYYLVEIEQVLARVRASASEDPHLFLFDELFRGTNAVERIAAGEAVLREMVRGANGRTPHVVIAATHDAELVDLLHDCCDVCHFADSIGPEGLVFEYRLQAGSATTRNAIALLELSGAPASVVSRATARAAALDRQRGGRVSRS